MSSDAGLPTYSHDAEDIARHFNVTSRTVRRWAEVTDIPHRRIENTLRFNLAEVDEWAARGGRPAEEPAA